MTPGSTPADDPQLGDSKQGTGGMVFLATADLAGIVAFYTSTIGMTIWHQAPEVTILRFGNLLLGLHDLEHVDSDCLISFTYSTRTGVDRMYRVMLGGADGPPRVLDQYGIYTFFAQDPEGRKLEFQHFLTE